jgi:hypothetical protein
MTHCLGVFVVSMAAACGEPTAPAAPQELKLAAPAPRAASIRLRLVRFAPGSGEVLVSSGIPLPPGLLRERDLETVALRLGNEPPPMHVEALRGRHADGSLRSILIQFRYDIRPGPGFEVLLEMGPGVVRTGPDPERVAPEYAPRNPLPEAVALPAEPSYLIATGIVGETTPAPSRFSSAWEQNFRTFGDPKWQTFRGEYGTPALDNNKITTYNYYDRALIYFAWWARTGDPEYWKRAVYYYLPYRDGYMKPNRYAAQPHNIHVEGMEVHYLLTGDLESWRGAGLAAEYLASIWMQRIGDTNHPYTESRIQARTMDGMLTAARLGITARNYDELARKALTTILSTQQDDGSYRFASVCNTHYNYMTGLVHEVFMKYYAYFEADPRILESMKRSLDFMWNTQWLAGAGAFKYASADCPGKAGPSPAADLNLLIANGFAWYARATGNDLYRARGDQVFRQGVAKAWLVGDKQFNENYRASYHYEAYRR